jgi:uncharacterized membrane protein
MKKTLLVLAFASAMIASASAQSVTYPAGTTPAQKAAHEAQRAKAAGFQASLVGNPTCVQSPDKFTSCDPDRQVRQNYRTLVVTQGSF